MRRPGGYAVSIGDDGVKEFDTFTCCHCSVIVFLKPNSDPGGFCRLCMKPACAKCADTGKCDPFEKKLEREERRAQLMRAMKG